MSCGGSAVPGTVIGVSYILAFNVPPIEITGTAFVLVMCFVFRNMPVGVRAGIWQMPVPSLMRLVCEPYQASGVRASEP